MRCRKIQKTTENEERNKPRHIDTMDTTTAMIESSHFFDQQSIDNCKALFVLHCKYLALFRYADVYHWIVTIPEIKKKAVFSSSWGLFGSSLTLTRHSVHLYCVKQTNTEIAKRTLKELICLHSLTKTHISSKKMC